MSSSHDLVEKYLERLGMSEHPPVNSKGLRAIQEAHLTHVPFENLAIHMGEEIPLTHRAFAERIAGTKHGGICYELNGALYWLLKRLGFDVALASSRVWRDKELSHPGDHMIVLVNFDSRKRDVRIADVGFGVHSHKPLRLHKSGTQHDVNGDFVVRQQGSSFDVLRNGVPVYRIEPGSRDLKDFRAVYWWQRTNPDSINTQRTVCSLPTADGRVTISNNELTLTRDGNKTLEILDDTALLAAYRRHFDLELTEVPKPLLPPQA